MILQNRYEPRQYEKYLPIGVPPMPPTFLGKVGWVLKSNYFTNFLWAVLYLAIVVLTTAYVLVYVDNTRPDGYRLPDQLHFQNTYLQIYPLIDFMMFVLVFCGAVQLVWPLRLEAFVIIRRCIFIFATQLLLRDFTIAFTHLPDASARCPKPAEPVTNWTPWNIMGYMVRGVTCGDMIYSGHTCALLLPTYIVQHYFKGWLCVFMWACFILIAIFIGISRLHYSVDIILAFYIFTLLWTIYHAVAEHPDAFADQLPALVRWFFIKMEWSCPYYPYIPDKEHHNEVPRESQIEEHSPEMKEDILAA